MGTTQYLMMLSELPEYNSKIKAGFLLGTTAFGGNASETLVQISEQRDNIQFILETLGHYEFLPNYPLVRN